MICDNRCNGTVKPLESYNPFVVAYAEIGGLLRDCARDGFRPWRWVGRFINKPGWSPDGNHSRSSELKAAYLAAHPEQTGTPGLPAKYAQKKTPPQQAVAAE